MAKKALLFLTAMFCRWSAYFHEKNRNRMKDQGTAANGYM